MTIECRGNGAGGGGKAGAKRHTAKPEESKEELGALKLDETEISEFERWATETAKPTPYMVEAAKVHRVFQVKKKR